MSQPASRASFARCAWIRKPRVRLHRQIIAKHRSAKTQPRTQLVLYPVARESGWHAVHLPVDDMRDHDTGNKAIADQLVVRPHIIENMP